MIINLNKPVNISSYDCIRIIKQIFKNPSNYVDNKIWSDIIFLYHGGKIGHAGTLDPFADGVLIICTDKDTKKIAEIQAQPKEYKTLIKLGKISDTYDIEGKISVGTGRDLSLPTIKHIHSIIKSHFTGEILQTPPIFSAKKIQGKRAYQLARVGREVKLAPKKVVIYNIGVNNYNYPNLELTIECGSGTYIRSIAHDLGQILKTGAYCHSLTRTRVGEYRVENSLALPPEQVKQFQKRYRALTNSKLKS